ncbi:MAG: right-handed parallel beta-helix repeat-containing protein [Kiritimatiellia bacterium]
MKNQLSKLLLAAAGFFALSVQAETYWAAPDGTADAACTEEAPGTIAAALAKCVARTSFAEGDVVLLKSGVYDFTGIECVNNFYSSLIPVNKAFVTIKSETDTPEQCVFRGWGTVVTETELKDDDGNVTNTVTTTTAHRQRCFSVTGPALIRGIRFEHFVIPNSDDGAGIFRTTVTAAGALEVENCTFTDISIKSLSWGGTIGTASVYRNCTFADNVESNSNVGFLCRNPPIPVRFEQCSFLRNSSPNGLLYGWNISLIDCTFQENLGSCLCQDISLARNCSFSDNQTRCIQTESNSQGVPLIDGCTFTGNTLVNGTGAGVRAKSGVNVLVTNSRFEGNHTTSPVTVSTSCGGVAGYYGTYSNCVFKGNWADNLRGGGGTVRYATLQNCTIEGNDSKTDAASTSIGLMDCTAINCLIKDNKQQNGKAVNYGNMLLNCTVVGSVTTSAAVQGGAVTNTIVYGTSGGVDIDTGDYSHVLYGTSSDAGTLTDCAQLAEDPFSGDATPETPYLPKRKSGAVDAGILLAEVGSVDYYGNKRLSGGVLDIGCAEYPLVPGTTILLR